MSPEESQYLPNDQTFQLNYKPNPRVLDRRGEWTAVLSERLGLSEWQISENTVALYNNDKTERAYVAFNRCGLTRVDEHGAASFSDRASEFVALVFSLADFGETVHVQRVAVKARFCTPYRGAFQDLLKRVRDRYVNLTDRAYVAIGEKANLTDIGAPANFEDEHGQFNTHCGPMAQQQAREQYFRQREETELPEVGLYYDIDYFVRPKEPLTAADAITKLEIFSREGWARHQRIRKLIMGT